MKRRVTPLSVTRRAAARQPCMSDTWWPSRYGPDDEFGSLNEITPAGVAAAAGIVRQGRVIDLSHELHDGIPVFPGRSFRQFLTTTAHQTNRRAAGGGPEGLGQNHVNWIVEQVASTSQLGTHIDALSHLQIGDRVYNGHRLDDIVEEYGVNRLGIETLPQIVTRGLMLDIARARGVERLSPGDVVTPADAEAALEAAGLDALPGDAMFFHTGWGGLWDDPAAYLVGEPGPGMDLAAWLVECRISVTGCDTWSFGPVPPEDADRPFEVPQALNARHGVVIVENLHLSPLAESGITEFLLVIAHPKPRGATGAWVAPLAIV
jgi:kynurenine formamidase